MIRWLHLSPMILILLLQYYSTIYCAKVALPFPFNICRRFRDSLAVCTTVCILTLWALCFHFVVGVLQVPNSPSWTQIIDLRLRNIRTYRAWALCMLLTRQSSFYILKLFILSSMSSTSIVLYMFCTFLFSLDRSIIWEVILQILIVRL